MRRVDDLPPSPPGASDGGAAGAVHAHTHGAHPAHTRLAHASAPTGELAAAVNAQVQRWVYWILDHQLPSGWLGPDDGFGGKGNDYWSGWNVAASLLQYADAHPGSEVAGACHSAVLRYVTVCYQRQQKVPFSTWSRQRWQDWAYIVQWLLDAAPQGEAQMLWDAAELAQQQGFDWDAYYDRSGGGGTPFGNATDAARSYQKLTRIAYNALPATLTPDMWAHQYLQQVNEIVAAYGEKMHVWQTDGPDSTGFGVAPNFGCCTANFNQGWPKAAMNVLYTFPSAGGAVGVALGSVRHGARVAGAVITVDTDYPFGDDVTVTVNAGAAAVPLRLRIPGWAAAG
eukprot:gene43791-59714_t